MGDERSNSNLANGSLSAPITMANFHRFDDVAHIGIRLGTGNHQYTICIYWLLGQPPPPVHDALIVGQKAPKLSSQPS